LGLFLAYSFVGSIQLATSLGFLMAAAVLGQYGFQRGWETSVTPSFDAQGHVMQPDRDRAKPQQPSICDRVCYWWIKDPGVLLVLALAAAVVVAGLVFAFIWW
jgi:hypothetical protein